MAGRGWDRPAHAPPRAARTWRLPAAPGPRGLPPPPSGAAGFCPPASPASRGHNDWLLLLLWRGRGGLGLARQRGWPILVQLACRCTSA